MVDFHGYDMPVTYDGDFGGVMKEHNHTRKSCGIFDVSHMGQVHFRGKHSKQFLEAMTVADLEALKAGQSCLSLVMNEMGGIKDDCIISKVTDEHYYVVLNAGCKDKDLRHFRTHMARNKKKMPEISVQYESEQVKSLIAVQGPQAQGLLQEILDEKPNLSNLGFMETTHDLLFKHDEIIVSRCGYTGEDGFEVSLPNAQAEAFMDKLLAVKAADGTPVAVPCGLGARDSLRIEAGLCLYGNELKEDISPIKAMLAWTISKRRREELGFLGDTMVKLHLDEGVTRKRCGFVGDKIPVRGGTELFLKKGDGSVGDMVGYVTSGTVGPSVGKAVGMAFVDTPHNKFNTELLAMVRGKPTPVTVNKMPFVPAHYYKKP